jgi:K+-transporting ATPase ATPase B chain
VRNYDEQAVIIQCRGTTGVLKPPSGPLHLDRVDARRLQPGDVVLVGVGQEVPADGEILEGCAAIDQSAITGESTPVLREAGGLTEVLGGTRVLGGQIVVRVTRPPSDVA